MKQQQYVQYGCGLCAPKEWTNFDVSPTLRIQKTPILGRLLKNKLNVIFPDNVQYGNIVDGLPIKDNSCKGVYSSHTLEHLALEDFRTSLKNTYKILKSGGIFRCVVPDLDEGIRIYIEERKINKVGACSNLIKWMEMGRIHRPNSIFKILQDGYRNSAHMWLWDEETLKNELKKVGFIQVRRCAYNDCIDPYFKTVEQEDRFLRALAIEGIKP